MGLVERIRSKVTQFLYDAVGRLAETRFLGSAGDTPVRLSSTSYDGAGRVYQSTDARSQTTTFVYDDAGRRVATINALNQRTDTLYDANGNAQYITDAKGHTVENVYDALNRKVRTVFAPTSVAESTNGTVRTIATETVTVYDELGRRVAEYEQSPVDRALTERRATRYIYDKLGRLSAVVQPEVDGTTPVTRYTYDELGSQLTQTDALNHTTNYKYDDLGRRIGRQLPGGQSETMTYFRSGAVKDRVDFNGTLTSYTYDHLNRLLSRTSNHTNAAASNVSFTYTASGQRQTMTDATGTTTYGYDHRDRLTTKATPQGTIVYDYEDASCLLTGMHTNTPNGAAATYTYDELSRLKTVSDVNQQTTTYGYDANGNLKTVTLPNGVKSIYAYSDTNRLENLGVAKAGNTLAQFAYTLAPTGHRYRSAETGIALQPGSPSNTRSRAWQYDALWRLRNETLSGGTALGNGQSMPNGSVQYALDAVGNRKSRTSSIAGLASQNFNFDSNDRVQGDLSDNNGNTLNGTVSQPSSTGNTGQDTYDAENRLIARNGMIATSPGSISIAYNGDGHKVAEATTRNGITTTVTHLVDELNPTGYAQVIEEKSNGTLSRVYLFGHDLISQDVADENSGQWELSYFGYDGHGSTRFLTNSTGAVTDTYEYDAFGELLAHTGNTQNRYRYCGEQYSETLGLYYLRARLMNPLTGRFWTMDSYEGVVVEPQSLHKYTYTHSNPIAGTDPSGHFNLTEIAVTALLVFKAATVTLNVYLGVRDAAKGVNALMRGAPVAASLFFLSSGINLLFAIASIAGPNAPPPPTNLAVAFAGGSGIGHIRNVLSAMPELRRWFLDNILYNIAAAGVSVAAGGVLALPPSQYEGNHSIPKFLGGLADQNLHWLRQDQHRTFHNFLEGFLNELGFSARINGRFRSTREWEVLLRANPGLQDACFTQILRAARETDKIYGTSIETAVWDNLVDGLFIAY